MKTKLYSITLFCLIVLYGIYIIAYKAPKRIELANPYVEILYDDDTE
jgi:hypothetical protein